ncbi:hypothetical protein GGTG_11870 [Gaeumannomyces tritici R3-111a-1]|uniref:Uncharacterized protein n=1 Tax=Gaeumannomyces tritici (strain R3-111a-1) TaxID=644352 RepID=J3PED9_GAET3|nr:hypothetical protein GGTG_11870 [Gaeumannomyces tritici R3-111a-1]EJT70847.1 hypothetical protein GGTG_11870 [Gaeumannomyces tritici R3-111a-1]
MASVLGEVPTIVAFAAKCLTCAWNYGYAFHRAERDQLVYKDCARALGDTLLYLRILRTEARHALNYRAGYFKRILDAERRLYATTAKANRKVGTIIKEDTLIARLRWASGVRPNAAAAMAMIDEAVRDVREEFEDEFAGLDDMSEEDWERMNATSRVLEQTMVAFNSSK